MAAMIRTLVRVTFAPTLILLSVIGSAQAQSQPVHHAASPLLIPALVLIGAGAYLAYRRSRPTN
jgi:hypothetical protein